MSPREDAAMELLSLLGLLVFASTTFAANLQSGARVSHLERRGNVTEIEVLGAIEALEEAKTCDDCQVCQIRKLHIPKGKLQIYLTNFL